MPLALPLPPRLPSHRRSRLRLPKSVGRSRKKRKRFSKKTATTTIWARASYNFGISVFLTPLKYHTLISFTAPCARNKSLSLTPLFSTARKGISLFQPITSLPPPTENTFPSCRRRDAATTTSSPYLTSLGSPTKVAPSYNNLKVSATKIPTYIPALQPTPRTIPDGRIPAKFHDGKSDLDPTEWKPADPTIAGGKSPTQPGEWKPKLTHRSSSEASSYLSKFHHSSESLTSKRRPMVGHSGMTVSSRSIPGLSDTPTASTSSEESLSGTPYEFVGRSALSMPVRPANIASGGINASNDLTYEKKRVRTSLGSASGSLKKLLENTAGGM